MKTNGNDSASAVFLQNGLTHDSYTETGLTKREHFAGLAMQGNLSMLRNMEIYDAVRSYAKSKDMGVKEFVANEAVYMADLLIDELNKTQL